MLPALQNAVRESLVVSVKFYRNPKMVAKNVALPMRQRPATWALALRIAQLVTGASGLLVQETVVVDYRSVSEGSCNHHCLEAGAVAMCVAPVLATLTLVAQCVVDFLHGLHLGNVPRLVEVVCRFETVHWLLAMLQKIMIWEP